MTGGILTLASGRHSIQIEAADSKGEVTAYYFAMDAAAGKTFEKPVRLFPVRLALWWPYRREGEMPFEFLPAPPGARGPEGLEGAPGRAYQGWKGAPGEEDTVQCLKAAVLLRLDDLEARAQDAAGSLPAPAFRFHAYVYDYGEIRPEPSGPQGSPGAQGIEGLPADVFVLEDAQGQKLLDRALDALNWLSVAQSVKALELLSMPRPANASDYPPRLRLLTPEWRARYEQKRAEGRKASLAAPPFTGTISAPGAIGPNGQHGTKGADGVLPPDAAIVRLAPQQVQRLLDRLKADPKIQERLQRLQEQTRQATKEAVQAFADVVE